MERYKDTDTDKLLQTLKQCVGKSYGPGLSPELRELIGFLKSQRLRHRSDAHAFCVSGLGMRILQDLVRDCEGCPDCRDLVLVLGTIGNLCALGTEARQMVEKSSVEKTMGYLDSHSSPEVLCTVIRVLANLALDHTHNKTLQEMGVVNKLSQLLSQADLDLSCKTSITRALRILCTNQDCREELKWSKGVEALTDALRSDNEELASGAIQALEVVSVDEDILHGLGDKEVMQLVVRFCSHGSRTKVRRSAQCVLLNAAKVAESRRFLSSAGGIETLVALMDQSPAQHKGQQVSVRRVVCAVCMCCRDAMSRQRLRDCGGLEKMIAMLAVEDHAPLHGNIMGALVAFYFDEITLRQMVTRMGLLKALNYHLQVLAKRRREGVRNLDEHGVGKGSPKDDCEERQQQWNKFEASERSKNDKSMSTKQRGKMRVGKVSSTMECELLLQDGCVVGKGSSDGEVSMDGCESSDVDKSEESEVEGMIVEGCGIHGGSGRVRSRAKRELPIEYRNSPEAEGVPNKRPRRDNRKENFETTPTGATPTTAIGSTYNVTVSATPINSATPTSSIPSNSATPTSSVTPIVTTTPPSATPPSLLDSLLSSPSPFTSPSPSKSSPWTPGGIGGGQGSCEPHARFEGHVIMMISRISHLRDCLHTLSYADTLTTLLDYLTSDPSAPNEYIFRVLSRVLVNAHCFQNAVVILMPSRIQTCLRKTHPRSCSSSLCSSDFPEKLAGGEKDVRPRTLSSSSSSSSSSDTPRQSTDFSQILAGNGGKPQPLSHTSPSSSSDLSGSFAGGDKNTHLHKTHQTSEFPGKLADSWSLAGSGSGRLQVMLRELLVCLNKNADCAYGEGVLEHLYLTGGERERHASCLAATLLCKSSRFCHRLLLDGGAYQLLSAMATDHSNSLHKEALDALLTLASNMITAHSKPHPSHTHNHTPHPWASFQWRKNPFLDITFQDLSIAESDCNLALTDAENVNHSSQLCRFKDTDHLPFDLTLVVHTSSNKSPLQLQVHASILAEESDVFKVMLGGHYKESSSAEVHIRSALACGFVAMVHFIYGCEWNCSGVRSQLSTLLQMSSPDTEPSSPSPDVIFEATNQLLADITANCHTAEDAQECEACLQTMVCAGRFLLPDLIATCEHAAVKHITTHNVVAMFNLSQLHQCFCLAESCIRFILLMPHSEMRTDTFGDLLSSPEAQEALLILRMLLTFPDS